MAVVKNHSGTTRGTGLLLIFGGLPGAGKTVIARQLAGQLGAVYLRIDSIETALRSALKSDESPGDTGYRIAYALAEDNLRLGHMVVTDSVNPLALTRDAWLHVAKRAQAAALEIELQCSNVVEHRRRVETRVTDISGLTLPSWQDVVARHYEPWDRKHLVIDTSARTVEESIVIIKAALPAPWRGDS